MKITINNKRYIFNPKKCLPLQLLFHATAYAISLLAILPFVLWVLNEN